MTAKEMFEKLGYKCTEDVRHTEDFISTDISYEKDKIKIEIWIYNEKGIRSSAYVRKSEENYSGIINYTFDEIKAINKQVEELGWN